MHIGAGVIQERVPVGQLGIVGERPVTTGQGSKN